MGHRSWRADDPPVDEGFGRRFEHFQTIEGVEHARPANEHDVLQIDRVTVELVQSDQVENWRYVPTGGSLATACTFDSIARTSMP